MTNETLITLLSIVLPVLGAGIGYLIKSNVEKRRQLLEPVNQERRELYQQFVDLIIDIFKGTKTGKQTEEQDLLTQLYTFYKKYILYASPEVIIAFSDYFQYLYKVNGEVTNDFKIHFQKLTHIMAEMRKDLGLSNKKLGNNGEKLFRALITDFDSMMK